MPNPPPASDSFDILNYIEKIDQKTQQIEQESQSMEDAIEWRDAHLVHITQSLRKDLALIQNNLGTYKNQLELVKKDLLAILKNYKLAARKDKFEKLQQHVEKLAFERNLTRLELKQLSATHPARNK